MDGNLLKENNFVSAVVYINDTSKDVGFFLKTIAEVLDKHFRLFEIICVLDGRIPFENIINEDIVQGHVSLIRMGIAQGVEASMNAGMNLAIGDYVIEFDSTYQDFDAELIMEVYRTALKGFDVVGARVPKQYYSLEARVFYKVFNFFSSLDDEIGTERFRVISRRAINRVESYGKTVPYRKVVYLVSGLKVASIEYKPSREIAGNRSRDFFRKETAIDTLLLFTSVAYKVAIVMSLTMAFLMLFFLGYTCFIYFSSYTPVEGWSPIMGILTVGFFGLFLLGTFVIKYLELLLKINFKNEPYLVETVEKLK